MKKSVLMFAAGLALAAPVAAQDEAQNGAAATAVQDRPDTETLPDAMAESQKLFEDMFAGIAESLRADLQPIDPERLAIGNQMADKVLPDGVMKEMMSSSMGMADQLLDSSLTEMPAALAQMGGLSYDEAAALDEGTTSEVLDILDPYFHQRNRRMLDAVTGFMEALSSEMEPIMRGALGRAYASRFTLDELKQTRDFFATPAGNAFAAKSYYVFTDPEMMASMAEMMPVMMSRLPDMMAAIERDDSIPEPRKIAELSDAERTRLADLLGVEEDELSDPPTDDMTQTYDDDAKDMSDDTATDT